MSKVNIIKKFEKTINEICESSYLESKKKDDKNQEKAKEKLTDVFKSLRVYVSGVSDKTKIDSIKKELTKCEEKAEKIYKSNLDEDKLVAKLMTKVEKEFSKFIDSLKKQDEKDLKKEIKSNEKVVKGELKKEKAKTKFEKPDVCIVCVESVKKMKTPLDCGHWIHLECVVASGKQECPLCKKKVEIDEKDMEKCKKNGRKLKKYLKDKELREVYEEDMDDLKKLGYFTCSDGECSCHEVSEYDTSCDESSCDDCESESESEIEIEVEEKQIDKKEEKKDENKYMNKETFDKLFRLSVDKLYVAKENEKSGIKTSLKNMFNKLNKKDQKDYQDELELICSL